MNAQLRHKSQAGELGSSCPIVLSLSLVRVYVCMYACVQHVCFMAIKGAARKICTQIIERKQMYAQSSQEQQVVD